MLCITVRPLQDGLQSLLLDMPANTEKLWGIALASHLEERKVAQRMADAAQEVLGASGYRASIQIQYETTAFQPGAALALFGDLGGGSRLGADMAGAPGRRAESIGKRVSKQLLEEIKSGATLDRYTADQMIPFAALASGQSRFRVSAGSEHIESNAWLAQEFLGAEVALRDQVLTVSAVGFRCPSSR